MTTKFSSALSGMALASALLLGATAPALAMGLDDARAQGLICEAADGLLRAQGGGGDVQSMVQSTNAERMKVYQDMASKEGVPVSQIQAVSGGKLRQKYPACK